MKVKDLIGKTITNASFMKKPDFDDTGYLALTFSENTKCVLVAGYGGWTDESEDEYPTHISIHEKLEGLIPFDPDTEVARGKEGISGKWFLKDKKDE